MDWHARYAEQAAWTRQIRSWLLKECDAPRAARILEVGCGTGAVLADTPPTEGTRLFGVDTARPALRLATRNAPQAACTQGDALRLPYASRAFDIVLCHFLLLWLPDPLAALREMRRVTRPGGCVLALAEPDYGGRIDHPPALAEAAAWQVRSLRAQGADPEMGRKLPGLLRRAGLHFEGWGILGAQQTAQREDDTGESSEWGVFREDMRHLSRGPAESQIASWERIATRARRDGERVLFVPLFYAWGKAAS